MGIENVRAQPVRNDGLEAADGTLRLPLSDLVRHGVGLGEGEDDLVSQLCFVRPIWSEILCNYRVVQMNFTPEMELYYMLIEISLYIFSMTSLNQHRIL